jgi:hypothetical protein
MTLAEGSNLTAELLSWPSKSSIDLFLEGAHVVLVAVQFSAPLPRHRRSGDSFLDLRVRRASVFGGLRMIVDAIAARDLRCDAKPDQFLRLRI